MCVVCCTPLSLASPPHGHPGLAMLPSETEIMEQEVKVERQKRAQARKERYPDEQASMESETNIFCCLYP